MKFLLGRLLTFDNVGFSESCGLIILLCATCDGAMTASELVVISFFSTGFSLVFSADSTFLFKQHKYDVKTHKRYQ